ncbi:hypothetical protein M8C21_016471, partial [Ambrosia artemisiifolia]
MKGDSFTVDMEPFSHLSNKDLFIIAMVVAEERWPRQLRFRGGGGVVVPERERERARKREEWWRVVAEEGSDAVYGDVRRPVTHRFIRQLLIWQRSTVNYLLMGFSESSSSS